MASVTEELSYQFLWLVAAMLNSTALIFSLPQGPAPQLLQTLIQWNLAIGNET